MKTALSRRTRFLVQSAMIAALYAASTLALSTLGIAYGPVQFRLSEALTILPVFTPAAIPGLAIGCFLSNLASPYAVVDMVLGTLATFLAAVLSRLARNVRVKNVPVLSALPPVLCNALIVGAEIAFFMPKGFTWVGFASSALSVGAGELAVCAALGLPLAAMLEKTGAAERLLK